MTRAPYHSRTTVLPVCLADVDQMLAMAVWAESRGFYPEAHTYLSDALAAEVEAGYCDLGHPACEDHLHSIAYHSADCRCGRTEADCTEE